MEYSHKSSDPNYYTKWYFENKDKVLTKKKERIICACGASTTQSDKYRHFLSKKHFNALEIINLKKKLEQHNTDKG